MEERNFGKELFELRGAILTEIMDAIEMVLKNTNKDKVTLEYPVEVVAVDSVTGYPATYNVTEVDCDCVYEDDGREMELGELTAESLVDFHYAFTRMFWNWL